MRVKETHRNAENFIHTTVKKIASKKKDLYCVTDICESVTEPHMSLTWKVVFC